MKSDDVIYELSISRIFDAPPSAVREAFTDPAMLAAWSGPAGMKWSPDAGEAPGNLDLDGSGPLPGLPVVGAPPGWLHLEFCAEPGARTRLELSQGPFTEPQESVARGWWDRALSHLDRLFEGS